MNLPETYHGWLRSSLAPALCTWSDSARERKLEHAAHEFTQRTTDEYTRRYAAACPVPGVDPARYGLREVALADGTTLLVGIHFRGQAMAFPFVGVFAQSRWLDVEEMKAAHRVLLQQFAQFCPRATWWWLPEQHEPSDGAELVCDQHLVMGALHEIRQRPAPQLPAHWQLRCLSAVGEVQAAFTRLYQSFHSARPDLARAVPASELDALVACAARAGLFGCFEGDEVVGVVALKPDSRYAVDAWLVWDIVLERRYTGRGLAPALQRAVLDRLDAGVAPLVAGTIAAENLPSLRTALRVGRQIVGGWYFLADTPLSR